ncbi:hypothetical protein CEXT_521641 [Caerostris extrusa]|uniref:Uncharacterized protein n=1 Tax=Caerostris extrusa TaxID=172846 RepID=A0AAV4SQ43_CAEEX|nr:hypothetical protein CEXT_521641 [Caerostris extrusa]
MALTHTHSRNSLERKATLKCIPGKSSQPFLITNETPTTCPLALKVASRPGRQRSFTDVMNTDSLFTVTVLPCYRRVWLPAGLHVE